MTKKEQIIIVDHPPYAWDHPFSKRVRKKDPLKWVPEPFVNIYETKGKDQKGNLIIDKEPQD